MNRETYAGTAMELLRFSIPMILGAVFQQMFSWADALIVGNFAGEQSLAAIGTTNSCYNLLLDLILGASAGLTVLAARYYGAGNRERLHRLSVTYVRLAGACREETDPDAESRQLRTAPVHPADYDGNPDD